MKKKRKLGRKLLSFLLTLAMTVGLMPGMGLTALAENTDSYFPVEVTGFDKDIIIDSVNNGSSTVNSTIGFVSNYENNGYAATFYSSGCRTDGAIPSGEVTTTTGKRFNIQPSTQNNVVQIYQNHSATLTFSGRNKYEKIAVLSSGGNGNLGVGITINYSDNTTDTAELTSRDWWVDASYNDADYTIVKNLGGVTCKGAYTGDTNRGLYEESFTVNSNKTISSITFSYKSGNDGTIANIFAVSGVIKSENVRKVTFNSMGGSLVEAQTVTDGGTATEPSEPRRDGFLFAGWSTKENSTDYYDFGTAVRENLTLYAQWANIKLDRNTLTVAYNDTERLTAVIRPEESVKWSVSNDKIELYSNADCTEKIGTEATKTLTVYVKGISAGSATVTCTSNADSSKSASCNVTVNASKANPTSSDFTFIIPANCVFDGTDKTATVVPKSGVTGMGNVTVKYYSDAACTDEVETPKNAGTYYVGITVTEGDNYDAITSVLHDENWKFTIGKASSTVTETPTEKTLTANGSAQSLINAGTASGGTMKYAVTTANQEPAADAYTFDNTSIPTATAAGTYYVWYKVVADANHTDTKPVCITVTINQKPKPVHTHKYADTWSSDSSTHWHACTGTTGTCNTPKKDEAAHTYGTTGTARFTCTVCSYVDSDKKAAAEEADRVAGKDPNKTTDIVLNEDDATSTGTSVSEVSCSNLDNYTQSQSEEDVNVKLEVKPESEEKISTSERQNIQSAVNSAFEGVKKGSIEIEYIDMTVTKTVNGGNAQKISDVGSALEIALKYNLTGKYNPVITRNHNGVATCFRRLSKRPTSNFADGTYYVEGSGANAVIYAYSRLFSTYSVAYTTAASWEVTFDDGNGNVTSKFVDDGAKVSKISDPVRSGYDFEGWYKGDSAYNFDSAVTSDITLTAKWTEKETVKPEEPAKTDDTSKTNDSSKTDDKKETKTPTAKEIAAANTITLNSGLKGSVDKTGITVRWAKVKGASKYEVYATYCGTSFSKKPIATISGSKTKTTIKKLNGKKLDQKKNVKVYVIALSSSSGKTIKAKSIVAHIAGAKSKKFTNVKAINLSTKSLSIKKGRSARIKATVKLVNSKKKMLSDAHTATFRYASDDMSIAKVDKNGRVKGIKKGSCNVYIYAKNGYAKKVKVKVK